MKEKKRRINVHREQEKAYGRGVNIDIDIGSHNLPGKGRNAFRSNPVTGIAIETRYVGPTNTHGSRITATTESGDRASMAFDHSLDSAGNHEAAARLLADKMGWSGKLVGGVTKRGYCWVFEEGSRTFKRNPVAPKYPKHPRREHRKLTLQQMRIRAHTAKPGIRMSKPGLSRLVQSVHTKARSQFTRNPVAKYYVQYENARGDWITLGAFPTKEQARDYAKAIQRRHKGKKLRLWWR